MMQYPTMASAGFGPPSPQPQYASMANVRPPPLPAPGTVRTRTAINPSTKQKIEVPCIAYIVARAEAGILDVEWRQLDISRPLDEQIKEAQQMARMLVVRHPNLVNHHGGIPEGPQLSAKESKDLERRVSEWQKGMIKEDKKRKKESQQWPTDQARGYPQQYPFPDNSRDHDIERSMKGMRLGDSEAAEREQQRIRRLSGGLLGLSSNANGRPRSRPPTPEEDRVRKVTNGRELYYPSAGNGQQRRSGNTNIMDFPGAAGGHGGMGASEYYGIPPQPNMDQDMMNNMRGVRDYGDRAPERSYINAQSYITPPPSQPSSVHHMAAPGIMPMTYIDPSPQMRNRPSPYGHSPAAGTMPPFHHSPGVAAMQLSAVPYGMPAVAPYGAAGVSPMMGGMGIMGGMDVYPPDHILAGQPRNQSHQNEYSPMPTKPPTIVPTGIPPQPHVSAYPQMQQQQQAQQYYVDPRMESATGRGGNIMNNIPPQPNVMADTSRGMKPSSRASSNSQGPSGRPSPYVGSSRNESTHMLPSSTGAVGFGYQRTINEETSSESTSRSLNAGLPVININRPVGSSLNTEPFQPFLIIPDLNLPLSTKSLPLPKVLCNRDVFLPEWDALMTVLLRMWNDRDRGVNKYGSAVKKIVKVLDVWNLSFFNKRGVDFVLFRGNERRSGEFKGRVEGSLPFVEISYPPPEDTDSEAESDDDTNFDAFGGINPAVAQAIKQKRQRQRDPESRELAHSIALFPYHATGQR